MGVHCKTQFLGGGGAHKKTIYRGNCLKMGWVFRQFADLRGRGVGEKEGVGWCF